ncbi:kinase, partial [Thraustotheca clavata]
MKSFHLIHPNIQAFEALKDPVNSSSPSCHELSIYGSENVNTTVSFKTIAELAHLETLILDRVVILPNVTDTSPKNMTTLTISNCSIDKNTPMNLTQFDHLIAFTLTKCSIELFPLLASSTLQSLQLVDLSNNALQAFPKQVLQLSASNVTINLAGNPFKEINFSAAELTKFNSLVKSQQLTVDKAVLSQVNPQPSPTGSTSNNAPSMVDPQPNSKSSSKSSSSFSWLIILTIVLGCCIIAGIVFVLVFRHRKSSNHSSTLEASFLGSHDRMHSPFSAPAVASPQSVPIGPFPTLTSYSLLEASQLTKMKVNPASGIMSAMYLNEMVLLKKLDVHSLQYDTQLERFLANLERVALLNHPNVVLLLGATKLSGIAIAGVFEYAEKGSLASLLANSNIQLSWALQLHMSIGLAEGLQYLHESTEDVANDSPLPWTSRDVFVQQDYDCKWSTLTWFEEHPPQSLVRYGSYYMAYLAPECLIQSHTTRNSSEVFTLGVLLGEIASRLSPYASWIHEIGTVASDARIADSYAHNDVLTPHPMDSSVPEPFQQLVRDCLAQNPSKRPTARDVVLRLQQICYELQLFYLHTFYFKKGLDLDEYFGFLYKLQVKQFHAAPRSFAPQNPMQKQGSRNQDSRVTNRNVLVGKQGRKSQAAKVTAPAPINTPSLRMESQNNDTQPTNRSSWSQKSTTPKSTAVSSTLHADATPWVSPKAVTPTNVYQAQSGRWGDDAVDADMGLSNMQRYPMMTPNVWSSPSAWSGQMYAQQTQQYQQNWNAQVHPMGMYDPSSFNSGPAWSQAPAVRVLQKDNEVKSPKPRITGEQVKAILSPRSQSLAKESKKQRPTTPRQQRPSQTNAQVQKYQPSSQKQKLTKAQQKEKDEILAIFSDGDELPRDRKAKKNTKQQTKKGTMPPRAQTASPRPQKSQHKPLTKAQLNEQQEILAIFSDGDELPRDRKAMKSKKQQSRQQSNKALMSPRSQAASPRAKAAPLTKAQVKEQHEILAIFSDGDELPRDRKAKRNTTQNVKKAPMSPRNSSNPKSKVQQKQLTKSQLKEKQEILAIFSDGDELPRDRKSKKNVKKNVKQNNKKAPMSPRSQSSVKSPRSSQQKSKTQQKPLTKAQLKEQQEILAIFSDGDELPRDRKAKKNSKQNVKKAPMSPRSQSSAKSPRASQQQAKTQQKPLSKAQLKE